MEGKECVTYWSVCQSDAVLSTASGDVLAVMMALNLDCDCCFFFDSDSSSSFSSRLFSFSFSTSSWKIEVFFWGVVVAGITSVNSMSPLSSNLKMV